MAIPQVIQELANKVRSAVYGSEVRESIAKSMEESGNTADEARVITEQLLDESYDSGLLNTEIERRMDDLYTSKGELLDTLHAVEKAELDALELDYSSRAENLETTYAPRLTNAETQLAETMTSLLNYPKIIPELDDTARLQRAINDSAKKSLVLTPINFTVSNKITLISNFTLIGYGATITQTAANKTILEGDGVSKITIDGLKFVGVGTDYTKASGSLARAINILGTTVQSTDITIKNCTFNDFSYAAIAFNNVKRFIISDNIIVGTGTSKGNVLLNDNYQFGIWLDRYCYDGIVRNNDLSETAIGFFNGYEMYNIKYEKNHVYNTRGQHGFYLSHGNKLYVLDNTVENCALNGIKLQQATTSLAISTQVSILNNKVIGCGSDGISLINVDPSAVYNIFEALIAFNEIKDCVQDGIHIENVYDSFVGFNTVINSSSYIVDTTKTRYGIYVNNAYDVDLAHNRIKNTNKIGIFVTGTSTRIALNKNNVKEAGQAQVSSYDYGIYIFSGDDITVDNNVVSDANAKMSYSFIMNTPTNVKIRNNRFKDKDVRFLTVTAPSEWDNNTFTNVVGYPGVIIKGRKANIYHGTVANAPTVSTGYVSGDRYDYTNPSAGGYIGKILIGTTWKEYGSVTP